MERVIRETLLGVVLQQMSHETCIVSSLPVDTIILDILRLDFILYWHTSPNKLYSPRPLTNHAEHKHLTRACLASVPTLKFMRIPCLRPLLGVLVYSWKEEVMEEPDMSGKGRVEATLKLKVKEKIFPLIAEPVGDVEP